MINEKGIGFINFNSNIDSIYLIQSKNAKRILVEEDVSWYEYIYYQEDTTKYLYCNMDFESKEILEIGTNSDIFETNEKIKVGSSIDDIFSNYDNFYLLSGEVDEFYFYVPKYRMKIFMDSLIMKDKYFAEEMVVFTKNNKKTLKEQLFLNSKSSIKEILIISKIAAKIFEKN